jgi:hypothetical protein
MQPYRSQQDITASANVPVDVARGRVAGTLGLFGDVFNQPIPMVRPLQLLSQAMTGQQKYPDTEYFLENLPLKSDTPVGDVAGRVGSFAPINPMPAVRGVQKLGGLLGEEVATRLSTGRPILPSLLAEPQTAMFAVEPNPSMAMADESSAMRQQLTNKMQALLAQKKIATSAVDVGSINQQIGELQAQFKSLPAMGRVAREVVVPEITAPVSNLGFYSATEQAAINLERSKGTGQSFLNDLMNAPDVKNYEIEAMGLDTYLKGKPNVTRQEVQDFITNNKISVEERQLGGTVTEDPLGIAKRKEIFDRYEPQIQDLYRRIDKPEYVVYDPETNKVLKSYTNYDDALLDNLDPSSAFGKTKTALRPKENSRQLQQQITDLQNIRDAEADAAYIVPESAPTKYGQFQLAGGENYRELLLKLPQKPQPLPENFNVDAYSVNGKTMYGVFDETGSRYASGETKDQALQKFSQLHQEKPYQSSHFPDPNILAHMRVNDRVDAEGKKMLLIEEVQSDWHQAGREQGYNNPKEQALAQEKIRALKEEHRILGQLKELTTNETERNAISQKRFDLMNQAQELSKVGQSGVPDAPFKDTWYQLALKRAIKEAVDKGYDRIGLTTGKRQIERYTNQLRQNVDEITYQTGQKLTDSEAAELQALRQKSLRDMTLTERARFDDLFSQEGDYVAKDETKIKAFKGSTQTFNGIVKNGKFIEGPDQAIGKTIEEVLGKSIAKQILENKTGTVKDKNLTVGGEGMKKYYDEVYPNYLEKYGKKYGAKVGETKVNTVRERAENSMIPSMGQEPVRYLDITPEMKKAVQKGQPLAAVEGMTGLLA